MDLLTVENLCKRYDTFELEDISFTIPPGYIMGFIGRNGAGKTTTIKAMLNLVQRDSGAVSILGQDYFSHEIELKKLIGLALGGVSFYQQTKLARITHVFRRFYDSWDETAYRDYLARFELDEKKKVNQLSAGMKVKYALALALSHQAKLLILDEPTSGLDPVSRDDLLDLFHEIIEDGERSILFSTQITSDLEKCADYITYIRAGRMVVSTDREDFFARYLVVKGTLDQLVPALEDKLIGHKRTDFGFTGLIAAAARAVAQGCETSTPDIEQIMIFHESRPAHAGARPTGGRTRASGAQTIRPAYGLLGRAEQPSAAKEAVK